MAANQLVQTRIDGAIKAEPEEAAMTFESLLSTQSDLLLFLPSYDQFLSGAVAQHEYSRPAPRPY